MALLNSGDSMALLAKELNPFSISPIMFCQIATGSLLLSAIGVLQHDREGFGAPPVCHIILLRQDGQHCRRRFAASPRPGSLLPRENPCHRVLIAIPFCNHSKGTAEVKLTAHQPPQIARANGIELCYEIFGDAGAEPMLLIMGLGAQMIHWDDEFCRQLAARGFRVIRFDNRDIGKSSRMTGDKRLGAVELLKQRFLKIPVAAPYTLRDMAEDTVGLMDVLGIKSAHLVGASMGGMIAQEIAISFPQRVRSLTSIMSTTGNPRIPPPTREAAALLMAPPPTTKDEYLARFAQTWKMLRVGRFPEDEAFDRARGERCFERGLSPAGVRGACTRCRRRPWSFTAPSIRWCIPPAARTPQPRSPARNS